MKIHLVSRDRLLERLCREGLAKLRGADWSLYLDPEGSRQQSVDLAIVDLEACPGQDSRPRNATTEILLYSYDQILSRPGPLPAATILLKPLHKELFLTVLGSVIDSLKPVESDGAARETATPRGEELLQSALRTNLELQRVYARQMHLLSRGLHDLRAPLTAIEGYSRLLLAERFGPLSAAQRENLGRMKQSIGRLARMSTDIFQLSLGERGEREPELQPGDIGRSIRQVLDEMTPLAHSKTIRLLADITPADGALHFDCAQLHSVLANLVENACRFTPRSGSIEVRGYSTFWDRRRPEVREIVTRDHRRHDSRRPNAYQVDVRDSGLGISTEHLESVFEPYTSYAGSQDRAGSGLGLAICRMVISAHGGRIFAQSGDKGAVFSFVLPFGSQSPAEQLPPQSETAGSDGLRGDVAGESA